MSQHSQTWHTNGLLQQKLPQSSLPFCLQSLFVQWPTRIFHFQLLHMIVKLAYYPKPKLYLKSTEISRERPSESLGYGVGYHNLRGYQRDQSDTLVRNASQYMYMTYFKIMLIVSFLSLPWKGSEPVSISYCKKIGKVVKIY